MSRAVLILEDMTSASFFDTMGKRIRILREDRRLNQTELAQRMVQYGIKIDPSYLSQIEGGTKVPRLPVLKAIAQVLETTADYLLLLSDEPSPPQPPDNGVGISEAAQRIAGLVDLLPEWRREELERWLESVTVISETKREEAQRTAFDLRAALGFDESVLGPDAMRAIEAALLRYVAGESAASMLHIQPAAVRQSERPRRRNAAR